MSQVIEFFWEAGSPYTYLAATQVEALARETGAAVQWKPFLIGAVFKARGTTLPAAIPAKAQYMFQDLARWARQYGVPVTHPKVFPVNSVLAARAAVAAADSGGEAKAALALLRAYWGEGHDISQPDVVQRALDGAGLDGSALLARTQDTAVKDGLRRNTDEAIERGAFGAPTFFVGKAMFWGNDRLDHLRLHLQGRFA